MQFFAWQFASPGPMLFEGGGIAVRWYGFLIASAVLIGVTLSQYLAKRRQVNPELLADLAIWLVLAAIPAARIYYVVFQWEQYQSNPIEALAIWKGGIAIHGAILGGTIAAIIFAKLQKVSIWQLADLVVPSLILGQAIGRWGNFFNSEAFGRPTDLPWKLYIPLEHRPLGYTNFEYFHPTFLYESLWNLLVFSLLLSLFFRSLKLNSSIKTGTLALSYLITYSIGRFWVEGLRTDSLMAGQLRAAQIVSLTLIGIGALGLFWLYKLQRKLPDVIDTSPQQLDSHLP